MVKLKKKIKELIKIRDDVTRSDLQGLVMVIGMEMTKDMSLRHEIDDRILMIIDNAGSLTKERVDFYIRDLEKDLSSIYKLKKLGKVV